MKQLMIIAALVLAIPALADTFGSGANQFTIEFVPISGDAGSANGTNISQYEPGQSGFRSFTDPGDFRIGTYEITNDQWDKFIAAHGQPNGNPSGAYDADSYWTGASLPTNNVSWYEAAQFVNWLNIEAGKTVAYKFTGTFGTGDYTLAVWDASDAWSGTNLHRHKDAFYFLPTEDEWVKAAYWNGTYLQTYATRPGESLHQGDGNSSMGWNYHDGEHALYPSWGPWAVGSGSEELNNTYDMMGNVWEWMESSWLSDDYLCLSGVAARGGSYDSSGTCPFTLIDRTGLPSDNESKKYGFRVASIVPEPCTLLLLGVGGMMIRKRK